MPKYNLALVPKKNAFQFIELARNHANHHEGYLLGEASLPHVTICQFYLEEDKIDDLIDSISLEIINDWDLTFEEISHLTFDGKIYWISLLPTNKEKLVEAFNEISKLVTPIRKDAFDPHLSLFNYKLEKKNSNKIDQIINKKISKTDEFELVLGQCDEIGQLTKVIKNLAEERRNNYSYCC